MNNDSRASLILGAFTCAGLAAMGYLVGSGLIKFRQYERVVSVKGLAERDVPADVAVWPIQFASAHNDLTALYASMEASTKQIVDLLLASGFSQSEVTVGTPAITDKLAQQYGNSDKIQLRYIANEVVTVYTSKVDLVRRSQSSLAELGRKGIAFGGESQRVEYMFTKLNDIKPAMIEEATRNARAVAEKFASDSRSKLGKIKSANQGQFTVEDRDTSTPHIKRVRVVSTVDYYLSD